MKPVYFLSVLGLVASVSVAFAQGESAPGQAEAAAAAQPAAPEGKALYRTKTCVACHGRDGGKPIQAYPVLAGQSAKYMLDQITIIDKGTRVGGPDDRGFPRTQGMKDVLHLVNQEERAAIANYLAAQPAPKPAVLDPAPDEAQLAAGKDAFLKGGCKTCHGENGLKPLAGYPILAGQKRDYLVLQLNDIRNGVRKGGKVAAMVPFAKKLDDEKITLIANFLSQIDRSSK